MISMSKLVCNFAEFNSGKNKICELIGTYHNLLSTITTSASESGFLWIAESEKAYTNKFLERKKELEKLGNYLDEIKSFLSEVENTYKNIEDKYS